MFLKKKLKKSIKKIIIDIMKSEIYEIMKSLQISFELNFNEENVDLKLHLIPPFYTGKN